MRDVRGAVSAKPEAELGNEEEVFFAMFESSVWSMGAEATMMFFSATASAQPEATEHSCNRCSRK